ncbi:unnamed protein product [Danaus chrysippus]|uniref:(African queen) hypothetical protein n=1 Tax=Danaus chrysippus TaxID=151541 RepID=A0A8J2RAF5_9NEOP|nr:unnamed protein product [Danaus chrysippus]
MRPDTTCGRPERRSARDWAPIPRHPPHAPLQLRSLQVREMRPEASALPLENPLRIRPLCGQAGNVEHPSEQRVMASGPPSRSHAALALHIPFAFYNIQQCPRLGPLPNTLIFIITIHLHSPGSTSYIYLNL